ncbi:fluoride efflux transporter FluC [Prochlorococcus sp. MIT 0603]|uniref:fluoride efflux transporter FluC n=1 Tax=Prochlorococcus sp. MIT 0603 TaxID=1499500 RepID=UPI0019D349E7|nr:CrcB family protein [Prochlorococcus sp. MIT 0603]
MICIGSISGALLRFKVNNDFIANVFGSGFLGLISGFTISSRFQVFLVLGFCASLTTFSGLILDAFLMINSGLLFQAIGLICITMLAGFLSLTLGFLIGQRIRRLFSSL